jgi:hypothetical protein
MVQRLPAGPSRRHPRSDACCGVVERDARLGILRDFPAAAHRNEVDDAQNGRGALASNGEAARTRMLTSRGAFGP